MKEFREEAVRLVKNEEVSVREGAKRLSISPSTLADWVKAFKAGRLNDIGKNHKVMSAKEMEMAQLRRVLAQVKMERDILCSVRAGHLILDTKPEYDVNPIL